MPFIYRAVHAGGKEQQQQAAAAAATTWEQHPAHDFIMLLLDLLHRPHDPPSHLAVVVDVPGPTWR